MSRQYVKLASSKIIFDGNSITNGELSGSGAANIPSQVTAQLALQKIPGVSVVNVAVGGQTCAQMIADGSSQVAPLREVGRDCILVVNEGGNDISFGATPQQAFENIRNYCLLRRSEGFYVLIWDCPFRHNSPSGFYTAAAYKQALIDFNALVRSGWKKFADAYMDTRKHFPYVPDNDYTGALNGGFWFPDCVHPSATGNAIIAAKLVEHLKLIPLKKQEVKPVPINNPTVETEFFCDFLSPPASGTGEFLFTTVSGTGATAGSSAINANGRPGMVNLTTGTTAAGRSHIGTATSAIELGGGETTFGAATQIPTLSNATERYSILIGFFDVSSGVNQTDGLYFLYDEGGVSTGDAASPNWKLVSCANSARTFVVSSIAVDLGWNNFKIIVNAAGTSADFYINGQFAGSISTNLPLTSARSLGFGAGFYKSVGIVARSFLLDWVYFKQILKVARGAW